MEHMPACSLCHNITTDNCYHTGPYNKFLKAVSQDYSDRFLLKSPCYSDVLPKSAKLIYLIFQ